MKPDDHIRRPPKLSPIDQVLAAAEQIKRAISGLRSAVKCLATKTDLTETERRIMGEIEDLHAAQTAAFGRMKTALEDLAKDGEHQTAKIIELQNSLGAITPAQKALLSELKENADDMATKLEDLAAIVDSSTPTPIDPPPA